jgi:hypothetical protein
VFLDHASVLQCLDVELLLEDLEHQLVHFSGVEANELSLARGGKLKTLVLVL